MIKHENQCVGCPTEMGCLGSSCPYMNVEVRCCEYCGDEAYCCIDGEDLCEQCAEETLKECFDNLTISEMAEALGVEYTTYD